MALAYPVGQSGSLEPPLLFELAARNNISLPSPSSDPAFASISTLVDRYRRFTSLDDFLHYYFVGMSVLITAADFESLAYEYFRRAHADGVVHAEVFFDPQAHTSRGVSYRTVVDGFAQAQRRAKADFRITSELIVCILRHLPAADGDAMYHDAIPDLEAGVIKGLGLSSTEKGNPPIRFKDTYADAERRGFRLTAHAGEEADVDYMASALHDLHVTRVDHGIKLVQDPTVLKEFADRNVMVTLCPLSNVELRCVKTVADLPVRTYLDHGVPFSINSDDPAYFGGYILANFCAVQDAFTLTPAEWERVVRNSIEGSWCSDERKAELNSLLDGVMKRFAP
ncbi:adenosine deaminase [Capronia epimyces CBS 606.96]|uniref:Adenine deaminase n=1 Tax=Capronia epimyces CBS 606.96 TaxID=1182542 RepID=W9Y380_9EURO|nr:adenosine deaminase [Capronia epimyces CBS 606.96]EXJ87277.1 adenosine deaminase [Capronia epimyces CBS 606.96]